MITADLIIPSLRATSKKQVLQVLANEAANLFHGDGDDILNALLSRERIGSTGIGSGVAIPHIKSAKVTKAYGILARLDQPLDYDAVDDQPVDLIFMLLAPADSKTTQHLKTLAQASRFLRDPDTCRNLRATADSEKLGALLTEWVKSQAA